MVWKSDSISRRRWTAVKAEIMRYMDLTIDSTLVTSLERTVEANGKERSNE